MCTKEEAERIVGDAERRMQANLEKSHGAIASTISNFMSEVNEKLDELSKKADDTILDRNSIHNMLTNLQTTSSSTLEQATKTNGRVNSLETWKQVHTSESTGISQSLGEVRSVLTRLNWLLITGAVVALLNLILKS